MSHHESVQVAIRVRPMIGREQLRGGGKNRSRSVVSVEEQTATVQVCNSDLAQSEASLLDSERAEDINQHQSQTTFQRKHRFKERNLSCAYDKVFGPLATQEDVYFATVASSVRSVVEGINCTVFAYGQTGTGKTFTILGEGPEVQRALPGAEQSNGGSADIAKRGIIPRAVNQLFDILEEKREEDAPDGPEQEEEEEHGKLISSTVYCSYLQIYNEHLYDLLQDQKRQFPLKIRYTKKKQTYVQGLSEIRVSGLTDILEVLQRGARNRAIRATAYNQASSRSHAILQLRVETEEQIGGISESRVLRSAKLNFVDLAGSEKWENEQQMSEKHLKEMARINKSLSHLGNVVQALGEKNRPHVPYRDSQLTRLLQDSLGGNTRTTIICTLSPAADCIEETVSTLQFADRAKQVMVHVKANEVVDDSILLARAQAEIARLRRLLREQTEATDGPMGEMRQENIRLQRLVDSLRLENADLRAQIAAFASSGIFKNQENEIESHHEMKSSQENKELKYDSSNVEEHTLVEPEHSSPRDLNPQKSEHKQDKTANPHEDAESLEANVGLHSRGGDQLSFQPAPSDITRALKDDLEENAILDDEDDDENNYGSDGEDVCEAGDNVMEDNKSHASEIRTKGDHVVTYAEEYAAVHEQEAKADLHARELRKLAAEEAKARDEMQQEIQQLEDIQRERRKLEEAMRLLRTRAPKKRAKKTNTPKKASTLKPTPPQEKLNFSGQDIGRSLSLYQCRVDAWYEVTVVGFDGKSGMHLVKYEDDGTKQWHQMEGRKYTFLNSTSTIPGGSIQKDPMLRLSRSQGSKKPRKKSAVNRGRIAGKVAAVRSVYGSSSAPSSSSGVNHVGDHSPVMNAQMRKSIHQEIVHDAEESRVEGPEDSDILASLQQEGLGYTNQE